jgi:hypothetical protein
MLEKFAIFGNVQPQLQPHLSTDPIASIGFPRVRFDFTRKRSFNNIKRAAGAVKQLEGNGKKF